MAEAQCRLGQLGAQQQHGQSRHHAAEGGTNELHAQGLTGLPPLDSKSNI